MTGLAWLANMRDVGSWAFCLTFVRSTDVDQVLRSFGAAPAQPAASAVPSIPFPEQGAPRLILGRVRGDWTVVLDTEIPPQGLRPEVLRRVSSGTETVSIYNDIGKHQHGFAHADGGVITAAVRNTVPLHWRGSRPDHLRTTAEEVSRRVGHNGTLTLAALLTLAEEAFDLTLDPEDLKRPWRAVPLLPLLDDLPPERLHTSKPRVNDPVVDLLLAHLEGEEIPRILTARCAQVMTEAGIAGDPVLTRAIQDAAEGAALSVTDDEPSGLALRAAGRDNPHIAAMLRLALAGRPLDALAADFHLHRMSRKRNWREQYISDFGSVDVPESDMQAAKATYGVRNSRRRPGTTDPGPAAAHVRRLAEAGMSVEAIAELGGITPRGVRSLLRGDIRSLSEMSARQILAIEIPPAAD